MDGERLGQYLLEERIATSGTAEVFRARRAGAPSFARPVCISRIHRHLARDPWFRKQFFDEATTGAKLHDRNIVLIEDLGESDAQLFLATEFVNGVDLANLERRLRAANAAMPVDAGVFIAHEMLAGLWAAHSALDADGGALRVVHGDVCPHNTLVSFGGEVKLAGFGIARAHRRLHQAPGDVARGRVGYMPMEQFQTHEIDARADLYSLGVTLFEMFTGKHPFGGDSEEATIESVVAAQAVNSRDPLASQRPDLPPSVLALIEQLLATSAGDRPSTALVALDVLRTLPGPVTGAITLAALMAQLYPSEAIAAAVPRPPIPAR